MAIALEEAAAKLPVLKLWLRRAFAHPAAKRRVAASELEDEFCPKFMSINERSEILSGLHKVNAELGVIYAKCEETRAVRIGVSVQVARNNVKEAIQEFQPDVPAGTPLEFPREKS